MTDPRPSPTSPEAPGDQAALALDNARLYAEAVGRAREAEVFADVMRAIGASLDLDTILRLVVEGARSLCASDMAAVGLLDPERGGVVPSVWAGTGPPSRSVPLVEPGKGLGGRVLETGRPCRTDDYLADPLVSADYHDTIRDRGIVAVLTVPIRVGERVDGLLFVENLTRRPFTDRDEAILVRLADHAAVAIRNARLFAETVAGRRAAEALSAVSRAVSRSLDPDEVARRIADSVQALLSAHASALFRVDPRTGDLRVLAVSGAPQPVVVPGGVLPAGTGVVGLAARRGQTVASADILRDERVVLPPEVRERVARAPYGAVLAAPLLAKGAVIGVLGVGAQAGRVFRAAEIELIEAFADQAAVALENARLYAETADRLTALQEAQAALRRSEERYRELVENANDVVYTHDLAGRVTSVNRAAERVTGYAREEVLDTDVTRLLAPEHVELARGMIARKVAGGGTTRYEVDLLAKDGRRVPLEVSTRLILEAGRPVGIQGIARDITDRRCAEAALRESRRALETLIANLPGMVYRCRNDRDWTTEFVSDGCVALTGYAPADLVGNRTVAFGQLIHPDDRARVWDEVQAALAERRPFQIVYRVVAADATEKWVWEQGRGVHSAEGPLVALEGFVTDVTERRRAEEALRERETQLEQARKLEAIGRLAGGVAHDFNNLLAVILGYGELMAAALPDGDPLREAADETRKAAARGAALTRQLLAFSRRQVLEPRVVDLDAIVAGTSTMLRRLIGEHIELRTHAMPGLGRVRADPGQIEQVLLNLAVNARDAMPAGGRLTIETANADLDEALARAHAGSVPGPFVALWVRDTGTGMDAETRRHLFEPFFTTKGPGRGTGLGLATVYGIVAQSGGHLRVESAPGRGTAIGIYLPRVADAAPVPAEGRGDGPASPGGRETVLVVEDEPQVRALVCGILGRLGYVVLEAPGGAEALRLAEGHPGPLDLLVTDVVMPRMSGPELADRLGGSRPGLRVLYMSGYADEALGRPDAIASASGALAPGAGLVAKPFTPDDLARRVRAALDA